MKFNLFYPFLILLSLLSNHAFSQNTYSIDGHIETKDGESLIGTSVVLKDNSDRYVNGTSAGASGVFIINNVLPGQYVLELSFLGFEPVTRNVSVQESNLQLGTIVLSEAKSTLLSEVRIETQALSVEQNEDTTAFNARAFKTNPDASAEDLLRKMPGMDLNSGKPKSQGEEITKVLVDGKPFFGDDPTSSLRNLPANIIDRIQVYDESSEQAQFTGFDDGNTTKTVNIITKPDSKEGVFGKLYGGYGNEDKYNAGGNVNYFKDDRRISLIGHTNNVNVQNFESQDLVGISGGRQSRGRRRGPEQNFMTEQQGGISRTNAIGINYSDNWADKVEVTGSYFFNNTHNVAEEEINRIYVLPNQIGQTYEEQSNSETENTNHRVHLRMNYTIDSNTSILLIPRFSAQSNNGQSTLFGQTLNNGSTLLNRTENTNSIDANSINASSMFLLRHRFKKKGRTLSLWANGGHNNNNSNRLFRATNIYEETTLNQELDQESISKNGGWNINSNLNYTEPLGEKSAMQIQYGLRYEDGVSDKKTHNFSELTQAYSELDSALSNEFTTKYLTHRAGLTFRYADSNYNFSFGANGQIANLKNERILPQDFLYERNFQNILPFARFQYRFSKTKNLRLYYRASTDAPSVTQLQDVIDNENPLQLSSGNPQLDQAYQHRLRIRYNATNIESSSTFFAMLRADITQNYIGRSTTIAEDDLVLNNGIILPRGAQYRRPENMGGYWNVTGFTTYGRPIAAIKSNLNLNLRAGFERTPGKINQETNFANNTSFGLGLTLSSNISENIDFTLSSTGTYNIVKNTLNINSDNSFYNQNSRFSMNYIFWKGLVFNSDLNHQVYTGLSEGFNQNFFLWNLGFGKKLFKQQQGEIKLSVFDVLGQNSSIQRTVSEIYSEDIQTTVLQRYFMLTFTYNLRFFKGGTSMDDFG